MHSVRTLAAQTGQQPSSLRVLMKTLTGTTSSLRLAFAVTILRNGYQVRRGFRGHLGMPVTPANVTSNEITTVTTADGYVARFRSGEMRLTAALDGDPEVRVVDEVSIEFVALECRDAQEAGDAGDEVYGSVAFIKPSDGTATHGIVDISKQDMGPKQRIVQFASQLYQGPFANITITCQLVERDSGDTTKYRRKFAEVIADAAKVGGAAAGVDAEAVAGGPDWLNEITLGLSNVVFDVIGADDDPYNQQMFTILYEEMLARKNGTLPVQVLKRGDDPKEIPYTHRQIVNGVDDGGDTGEYGFYFMVRTRKRAEVPGDFS